MEAQELIDSLRIELERVKSDGNAQVQVSALLAYLAAVEGDVDRSKSYREQHHAGMLAQYAAKTQQDLEMLKAAVDAGKSALHALVIINGGAVIALLGIMTNLVSHPTGAVLARYLSLPLLEFGLGVFCGALAFGFRFVSHDFFLNAGDTNNYEKWGRGFRWASIGISVIGYLLFVAGIVNAYDAIRWSFWPGP